MTLGTRLILAALLLVACHGTARANGRYPNASLIVFDPNDANHFVVSVTFGLLETLDGGRTFFWKCEAALEAKAPQDMTVAISQNGATVAAKFDGVTTTADGCSFRSVPELAGKNVIDLALRRSTPHSLVAFYSDFLGTGGFDSHIVGTDDDGLTWSPLGEPLPEDIYPITIDVAPSDASRIYLSARLEKDRDYSSALLRSLDGGATFQTTEVPETAQHRLAYIAAVHPFDPDKVYLRTNDPMGTRVWLTADGGLTFRKIFTGAGQLYGFAVSPDGTQLALGGPSDGIWVGTADGEELGRRADVRPTCLAWNEEGLWACADQRTAPFFSVGVSRDSGRTFEPVLRFEDLCGRTGCGADSATQLACSADWELVAPLLGATCGTAMNPPDAAPSGDANMERDPSVASGASGCGCSLVPIQGHTGLFFLLLVFWTRPRRRAPYGASRRELSV